MADDDNNTAHQAALAMLEAFASVGAQAFDLTLTTRQGEKCRFRKAVPLGALRRTLPALLDDCTPRERNVIVRPHGPHTLFIQLDDLDAAALERVTAAAFLVLATSPGNFQAWVAMREAPDADLVRRIRRGAGADPLASGATRVAGSLNFKDKYAPDFPRVAIAHSQRGHLTSKDELARLGLVAAAEPAPPPLHHVALRNAGVKQWPDYQRCLTGAPPTRNNTGPDKSRADFTWCLTALDWGWSVEETAARLMLESVKAQQNGERYALLTAHNAAAAVARRQAQRR